MCQIHMYICYIPYDKNNKKKKKEERKLSWETRAEVLKGFEVLPKRCNRETVSYMKGKRVPKD